MKTFMVACARVSARRKGGESDAPRLGLVTGKSLAGGKGTSGSPCDFCGEVEGHSGQCPVVS